MKILALFLIVLVGFREISGGCDSRCEPYNVEFLDVFEEIQPFTESRFYENELTLALENLPVGATNEEKTAAINEQLVHIQAQISGFYATIASLIGSKMPDLTDLQLLEAVLAGEERTLEFPYECIKSELVNIALKLKFLLEDSARFAEILKELACTKPPGPTTTTKPGC